MKTPDLTPAQLISSLAALVGLFVSQGLVSNDKAKLIGGVASIVIPAVWQLADAVIRQGRARAHAAVLIAQAGATRAVPGAKAQGASIPSAGDDMTAAGIRTVVREDTAGALGPEEDHPAS